MAAQKGKNPPPAEDDAKSNDSGATAAPAAPAKKGGKLKLILIVVLALVVGGGGAVGAMKFLGGGGEAPAAAPAGEPPAEPADEGPEAAPPEEGAESAAPPPEGGEGAEVVAPVGPQNIEFKPFIVNLNDRGGSRFLKLTMSVEADNPELADEINQKMPQFRDLILLLLSSLSYDDIATLDGKMRLRNQMLNRINTQLSSGKVRNIYFSEFVVQ